MKTAYKIAAGIETETETLKDPRMRIRLTQPHLIGTHNYAVGDVIDLEVDAKKKKDLVEAGVAEWYDPKPEPVKRQTASVLPKETASVAKGKTHGTE